MLDRMAVGQFPAKPHTALLSDQGRLRYEECLTRRGFDGPFTIFYHEERPHTHRPTVTHHGWPVPKPSERMMLRKRHYQASRLEVQGTPLNGRVPLCFNQDVVLGVVRPTQSDQVYWLNADADDLFFVHQGGGLLRSSCGDLRFTANDYLCIPKGILHRVILNDNTPQLWLSIECLGGLSLPTQWRTESGQLRMDAPYSHRDFHRPVFEGPRDESIREIVVKRQDAFHGFTLDHSPLDVVGWDGSVYPFVFPILNFQPRVGLVHLPPDWHGTFAVRGGLVCSFVPRPVDFHPQAVPCPYPHSSVDCDEIIYYVDGQFTSRRGVGPTSLTHHPAGVPHGPHPGAYESSLGLKYTNELAVMMDTYLPLTPTEQALQIEDSAYSDSFV